MTKTKTTIIHFAILITGDNITAVIVAQTPAIISKQIKQLITNFFISHLLSPSSVLPSFDAEQNRDSFSSVHFRAQGFALFADVHVQLHECEAVAFILHPRSKAFDCRNSPAEGSHIVFS